ncbi:sigma-54-dependent transcriptional regulator [Maridesulfovibrio zosterae]|uniref:sigma-54-dependent transcriptional regulator n=1 Tax=Maridesulfovibrio zosterae TaxID=82171 RepID=UPI00040F93D8|nr:sigma-54 dependent transcriptional regulator [Maridesulfovibrio zosterae]
MRILLVDDDTATRESLAEYLTLLDHAVISCADADKALYILQSHDFEMVLSDIQMPGKTGIELVREVKKISRPYLPDVVLYTGHSDLELAIGALRAGAYDYLTKPINLEELGVILSRVAEHQSLLAENDLLTRKFDEVVAEATSDIRSEFSRLQDLLEEQAGLDNIGFFSEPMWQVVSQARRYHEDRELPVLIQGETGVGKDIVAKIIHYGPDQSRLPFIAINCAALPASLFESELFGYEPGAFTGSAARGAKGKIDLAKGGTLFLDEIGEIPVELQAKLLRVIEDKSFYRVGGLEKINTDIRIIAATNLDLGERIERNLFRKDLYYRLKVGSIIVPPLRERPEDIVPLAKLFLTTFAKKRGKKFAEISSEAAMKLNEHSWPGNVRELKNTIEWISVMHDAFELVPDHLSIIMQNIDRSTVSTADKAENLLLQTGRKRRNRPSDQEIDETLKSTSGNKTRAAALLGISIRMLYYRLDKKKTDFSK